MSDKTDKKIILPPRDIQTREISTHSRHKIVELLDRQIITKIEDTEFVIRLAPTIVLFEKGLRENEAHNFGDKNKSAKKSHKPSDNGHTIINTPEEREKIAKNILARIIARRNGGNTGGDNGGNDGYLN